ncbi:MAG: RICIN domain-containing protein [Solitalea-like symbiont of Tyrophagus putrescentiae]
MKKLFLITLILYISLFSYNVSQAIPNEKPGTYGHVVYNVQYYESGKESMVPEAPKDMSNVHLIYKGRRPINWYLQYPDVRYKKFWYTDGNLFTKWRVLDVDWRNNEARVVIWPAHDGPNQDWEFIGSGNVLAYSQADGFEGVIINRMTGKMLEASSSVTNNRRNIYASTLWKGSKEQKEYSKNKNFKNLSDKSRIWKVWKLYH